MDKNAQFRVIFVLIIIIIALILIITAIYLWWTGFQEQAKLPEPGVLVSLPLIFSVAAKHKNN